MLKKLIVFVLLAGGLIISSNPTFAALTCEANNKVDLPEGKYCCCKVVSETDTEEKYKCEPTTPVEEVDENGNTVKKCPAARPKRISTAKNDTCICEFTKKK